MSDKEKKGPTKPILSEDGYTFMGNNWVETTTAIKAPPQPDNIVFHTGGEQKEILRFTEDKMFLYGEETECPQDIIAGMREWLTGHNRLENIEKARKYDAIVKLLDE